MNGHPGGDAHTMRMIELCALSPGARVLDMGAGELRRALEAVTVETLTPIEAMNVLYKLKQML